MIRFGSAIACPACGHDVVEFYPVDGVKTDRHITCCGRCGTIYLINSGVAEAMTPEQRRVLPQFVEQLRWLKDYHDKVVARLIG